MSKAYHAIQDIGVMAPASLITPVSKIMGPTTLDRDYSGDLICLASTAGSSVILPKPSQGLTFPFVVTKLGPHSIESESADIIGTVIAGGGTSSNVLTTTHGTAIETGAGSALGDCLKFVSDGDHWFLSGTIAQKNGIIIS